MKSIVTKSESEVKAVPIVAIRIKVVGEISTLGSAGGSTGGNLWELI